MTKWVALVPPRLGTVDGPGWCLRFAQSFFGAPARHNSAWEAWEAVPEKYGPEVPLPNVPVLLWFSHWGWYGPKGQERYANWGDVRIHVPGDAIYGSPITGTAVGQSRVGTIGEIERGIGATYVGWSPVINGLFVAAPGEEDDMTPEQAKMLTDLHGAVFGDDKKPRGIFGAIYDGIFKRSKTSQGYHAGLLAMLNAVYDADFKEVETSRGTPGGTLVTLRIVLEELAEIRAALGIESETNDERPSA